MNFKNQMKATFLAAFVLLFLFSFLSEKRGLFEVGGRTAELFLKIQIWGCCTFV